ncbi:hypothetical protein GE09DRAFT_480412 [Coniochaeta sp. 2T2.1]|nr:hypothetical protein GE09DRAFT_480412 [Coniochaeta sp. 2T2.1]
MFEVAGSAPSILPRALFVGPVNGTKYNQSRGFLADINPMRSTVFQFDLGELLRTPPSNGSLEVGVCALQFRLPVCTQLPDGYPCYQFSGMEQEVLQRSGMRIEFVDGSDRPASWVAVPLVQVWPGEDTLVGTFACGVVGPRGVGGQGGMVSWLAESVNGFELSFLQASNGGYRNRVGLFIVNCR